MEIPVVREKNPISPTTILSCASKNLLVQARDHYSTGSVYNRLA
jgi:hypothetical protein